MRRALLGILACVLAVGTFLGVQLACATRVLPFDPATCGPGQFDSAVPRGGDGRLAQGVA